MFLFMLIIDMLGFFQNYSHSHIHIFKFVLDPRKVVKDGVRVDKTEGSRNLDKAVGASVAVCLPIHHAQSGFSPVYEERLILQFLLLIGWFYDCKCNR